MVGFVRGSISRVTTSYPSSRSRLATDPVPENKSKALPFLRNLIFSVCPTGLSAIFKERTKSGGVTGLKVTGGEKGGNEVDELKGFAVVLGSGMILSTPRIFQNNRSKCTLRGIFSGEYHSP